MFKTLLTLLLLCATSALHAANYLTFTAEADSSAFGVKRYGSWYFYRTRESKKLDNHSDVQYSLDGGKTWASLPSDTLIVLEKKGDKALLKGMNPLGLSNYEFIPKPPSKDQYKSWITQFYMKGRIAASGSVMSLIDGKGKSKTIPCSECFYDLFKDCESLTQAPELPATMLMENCYLEMFKGCTNLKESPKLPAKIMYSRCYNMMFEGCTSLTQAPRLPSTALACGCYMQMFKGCTSLTQAPELPATSLTVGCYWGMFEECTSLTRAPELPATSLVYDCYGKMFKGCTNLTEISVRFTRWNNSDTHKTYGTNEWISGVASNGTFICPKELDLDSEDAWIPREWKTVGN